MIKFLIEREFKQLFRNSFLPTSPFSFSLCMIMILMPGPPILQIKEHQSEYSGQ